MIDFPSLADLAQAAIGGGYAAKALSPAILAAASRPLRMRSEASAPPTGDLLFEDGFESGDTAKAYPYCSAANEVAWGSKRWWNPNVSAATVETTEPYEGTYSERFRVSVGNNDPKQGFNLGTQQPTEVWVGYRLYIPTNLAYTGTNNNKMWVMFGPNGYPGNVVGSDHAMYWYLYKTDDSPSTEVAEGHFIYGSSYNYDVTAPRIHNFISDSDLGTHVQIRLHVKLESSWQSSGDGAVQLWKNGDLIYDYQNLDYSDAVEANHYFNEGFMFNQQSGSVSENVDFFVDKFEFFTGPTNPWI